MKIGRDEAAADGGSSRRAMCGWPAIIRLGLAVIALSFAVEGPASAQVMEASLVLSPSGPTLARLAPSSARVDGGTGSLFLPAQMIILPGMMGQGMRMLPPGAQGTQMMPNMPGMMPGMPGMQGAPSATPMQGGSGMGGGMAMMMTGEGYLEMLAGACAAGLFVGGVSAALAVGPIGGAAAPISGTAIAASAGIGCGFAIAATLAGIGGMLAWRSAYQAF